MNLITPQKNPQTQSLESPAIRSVVFISLLHQHMLSSKWDFMAAVRRTPPHLDWITFLPSCFSCVSFHCHSLQRSRCWVRNEWEGKKQNRRRPECNLLPFSGSQSHERRSVDLGSRHALTSSNGDGKYACLCSLQ